MKSKRSKKKNQIKKAIIICIFIIFLCLISIYLVNTYAKIDISSSNYQTERVQSTVNEQTVEKVTENSKNVADTLEETIKSVVGISKLKNTGNSIFSSGNIFGAWNWCYCN